jgi:hypothetical protein
LFSCFTGELVFISAADGEIAILFLPSYFIIYYLNQRTKSDIFTCLATYLMDKNSLNICSRMHWYTTLTSVLERLP